nr:MAG TPA: hypothetical protein [Caudoviricetes sp.]
MPISDFRYLRLFQLYTILVIVIMYFNLYLISTRRKQS